MSTSARALIIGAGLMIIWPASGALAAPARHHRRPDPRDSRIQALESELKALESKVDDLQEAAAQKAAAPPPVAPTPPPAPVVMAAAPPSPAAPASSTPGPLIATLANAPSSLATITAGKPVIASADGRFSANFHAILQFDAGVYNQAAAGPVATDLRRSGPALGASATNVDLAHARDLKNGDLFRRARIGVDGVAFGDFDYRIIADFGGSGVENTGQFYEGWVQYSGFKPFHIRVGAFSPSIGLEDQASTSSMPLIERTALEDMARGFAAGDTRTAASIWGAGDHWLASFAVTGRTVGVINTGTAAAVPQTFGDQLGVVGRLAATPLYGSDWLIHVGVHGSYVIHPPNTAGPAANGVTPITGYAVAFSNTQELRIDGTKLINTGNISANNASTAGLEFAAQKQNFYVQSEYERFSVGRSDGLANPNFHGFYVTGTWVLTGEARRYNTQTAAFDAPSVDHPFSLQGGGLGAFEIAARYSDTDLNYHAGVAGTAPAAEAIRGGEDKTWAFGLNWFPNSLVRFMLDYQHVNISRLSPCGPTSASASCATIWVTPLGAQIGQSYDAVAVRSQFAF